MDNIKHHGVKGMKWGVRRDASYKKGMRFTDRRKLKKMTSVKERSKYIDEKDSKWLEKVKDDVRVQKVAKATAKDMKKVNKELKQQYGGDVKRTFDRKAQAKFQREMKSAYEDIVSAHTFRVYGISPTRTREVEIQSSHGGTMKAVVVERDTLKLSKQRAAITKAANKLAEKERRESSVNHSALNDDTSNLTDMFFIITMDEDGFPDDIIPPFDDFIEQNDDDIRFHKLDEILQQTGVKGMRWGVRRKRETTKNKKTKMRNKHTTTISSKTSLKDAMRKSRSIRARMDVNHVDAKTGEYTNQSRTAKTLRIVDKLLGVTTTALITQKDNQETLQHTGVKGMRWGVHRNSNRPGGADGKWESEKIKDNRGKIRKNLDSMKREREWHKVLKDMHTLSTKDINVVKKRIDLENNLKVLSKTKGVATKKDKDDYLRREHMSDAELNRKVVRLRAKSGLHKAVKDASKEQRELGEKVVQVASSVGIKYAINRRPIKAKDVFKDVFEASRNPKENYSNAKKDLQKQVLAKLQSRQSNS